jgi:signal transduction histidine kinase
VTAALESVLQRLEHAFEQQRRFISDAAHELKTAVAVVKSSLQLVEMRPRTSDEYHAANERAVADIERIEEIVAKMLTLARVEAGNPQSSSGNCDVAECICRAVSDLRAYAAVHQVEIAIRDSLPCGAAVQVDRDECHIVMTNLLMNAIQHSPDRAVVEVRCEARDGHAAITIEDHGEGIPADVLPHVFERFFRGDPSRARATGGSGLGLAIAKAIVERAGGTISLASEPGRGTTVNVQLPCAG